jgi:spore coat polysaccharide biosynthesis protein SpsF (cytidylyltransferase family)
VKFERTGEPGSAKIFIVTSDRPANHAFERLFASAGNVGVFYGADANIPLRQLQCAKVNGITTIVSIDGDDILCSPSAAAAVAAALDDGADYVRTAGLPFGMNAFGYRTDFLEKAVGQASATVLETGWGRIFDAGKLETISLGNWDQDHRLRMTLDYQEDAEFFTKVIEGLQERVLQIGDEALVDFVVSNKIYLLNENINDVYWENFNRQKNAES